MGYWIGKKHSTEFFSSRWWKVLCADVGIGSVVLSFLLGVLTPHSWNFIREDVSTILFLFGIFFFEIILLEILVLPFAHTFKEIGERIKLTQTMKMVLLSAFYILQGFGHLIFGLVVLVSFHMDVGLAFLISNMQRFSIGVLFVFASGFSLLAAFELSRARESKTLTWGMVSSVLFITSYGVVTTTYPYNIMRMYSSYIFLLLFGIIITVLNAVSIASLYVSTKNK